ncbi:hypothetical protein G4B88_029284 [Cannabis sativa]|uniref:Uncharacterized protein n=1 Tax=Cannabis sativa TaxID=3483 RepID=A0A7J6FB08_CANSA|nr:hypothetical protein G4B88_029284 [Cannabis sativa]
MPIPCTHFFLGDQKTQFRSVFNKIHRKISMAFGLPSVVKGKKALRRSFQKATLQCIYVRKEQKK